MKTIYKAGGSLDKGFVGQISYTVCLDKPYQEMDICFTFGKRTYPEITEEMKNELKENHDKEYDNLLSTDQQLTEALEQMKTEIHVIASMNDTFIGGVHKQLTTRHLHFSPENTSEGCLVQKELSGVIKVTLAVFNVILDDTPYSLTLSVN